MNRQPTFISLFCGCGGLDAGFIQAGFRCLRAFDISKLAIEVHNKNLGTSGLVADLRDITLGQLLAVGVPDVVVAGSPCQGFSTAGRRDLHDPRNSLLIKAGEIALRIRPKVFIAENVAGALSGMHRKYWDDLEGMLRTYGYQTRTIRLGAEQVGLAQRRSRVILLAWLKQADPHLPGDSSGTTYLRNALANIEKLSHHEREELAPGARHLAIAQRIKPGQKLCNVRKSVSSVHTWDIPEVFGETSKKERLILEATLKLRRRNRTRDWGDADPIAVRLLSKEVGFASSDMVGKLIKKGYMRRVDSFVDLTNTFNGLYRRTEWDAVAPTVDTKFGDVRCFLHPDEHRAFTVREAARIQGFSDNFEFQGTRKEVFTLIGNAVPPPMGRYLAMCALSLI